MVFFFNQLYKMTRFSLSMWNWMMPTSNIISKLDFGRIVCYIYVHFTHVYSYHILLGLFLLCKTPIHKFLTVSTYCHPPRNLSKLILTISPGFSGELRCYCHNWRPKPWRCPPKLGRLEILVNLTDFFSLNTLGIILQKKVWTKCLYMDLSQMTHRQ